MLASPERVQSRPERCAGSGNTSGQPLKVLADLVSTRVADCRTRLNEKLVICTLVENAKKNSTFETCRNEVLWTTTRQFGFD